MLSLDLDLNVTAAIAAGASLSGQVNLGAKTLVGIVIPANWTTAGLSFQASGDGGATFGELLDETATPKSVSSVTSGAYTVIAVDPTKWRGINCIKIRSGTSAAPVVQVNAVAITLILRSVF
jgi:hypothetical protein